MIDNKKTSLVTGGAGFLGTNLCINLLQLGHNVICLDNFSTGKMTNIINLLENPDFCVKNGDVIDKHEFPMLDYIWHLACPASPPKYQANGYKTLQTSLIGTMNMLELSLENKCKLLFTRTSEVNGDPLVTPQMETYWGNVN
ncbi:MAG: NAD-dependent epimerase/dehydratase family protein, partial [Candidatus Paceibacterota bacterium]